ncbi:polar amino acid transport system substrate-binding protein [Inhella inkyongensis]|uniref:Polar amino acid transport system substrate-binding protein n=1 Tax=Inhella inkyongensis TaxID=392593 RepID=A0A840S6Q1_9BURK|nr:transporter substrate-binding domain-containing protein [Inhella inkyongensis]MBB5205188.1 polar amino acid transport system substrate-binding protein [Inhella inkyongensis]
MHRAKTSLLPLASWPWAWLVMGLGLLGAPAAQASHLLRICFNETPHPPWREVDAQGRALPRGLDYVFIELLQKRIPETIRLQPLPWRRCLEAIERGEVDAVFGISYLPERAQRWVYPPPAGSPDPHYAVRRFRFSWYVAQPSPWVWDGQRLQGGNAPARVVAQPGFSIAQVARELGYPVRESARTVEGNLHLVLKGEADAAALQTNEADRVLGLEPQLQQGIRKLEPALQQRDYFVVFSQRFHQTRPQRALALWQQMRAVRESEPYRQAEARALP